jgi:hypothetical protein
MSYEDEDADDDFYLDIDMQDEDDALEPEESFCPNCEETTLSLYDECKQCGELKE